MTRPPAQDAALTEQAEYWVARLASGEIAAAELDAFKAWRDTSPAHHAAFEAERAFWQSLEGTVAAFAAAPAPTRPHRRRWTRIVTPPRALAAAAAAAAIVALAPDIAVRLQADHAAATGEIRTIALPDGSTAILDSDAAIAVRFGAGERRIELLRGQAWFDVRHGDARPFRVAAFGGVTQDIGTAFEVSRQADAVTVAVTEGAVSVVATEAGAAVKLRALDRARYAQGGPAERLAAGTAASIASWRRGLIVIDSRPVRDAIVEIARYRRGYVLNLADTSAAPAVSGVFRADAPDEALNTVAQMTGLRVGTLPGGVVILRR